MIEKIVSIFEKKKKSPKSKQMRARNVAIEFEL